MEDCTAPTAAGNISTLSIEVKNASPIVSLEALPLNGEKTVESAGFRLIVTHQDGHVNAYDSNLKETSQLRVPTEDGLKKSKVYMRLPFTQNRRASLYSSNEKTY